MIEISRPGLFEQLGAEVGRLVDHNQRRYGDSMGKAPRLLEIWWPTGVPVKDYRKLLGITRIVDKLNRIVADKEDDNEDAAKDLAGYGLLMSRQLETR